MHSERKVTAGKMPILGVPVLIVQTGPVLGPVQGGRNGLSLKLSSSPQNPLDEIQLSL